MKYLIALTLFLSAPAALAELICTAEQMPGGQCRVCCESENVSACKLEKKKCPKEEPTPEPKKPEKKLRK